MNHPITSKTTIRSVTVYCSSSNHVPEVYIKAAGELGRAIADKSWKLVYGGNDLGCMKAVADGTRSSGGTVVGITPQIFIDNNTHDPNCDLIVADSMRHRKQLLEHHADAFIALPGGIGTLEELFEVLVGRALGYHDKPIVLLNIARYFDPLLAMFEHGIEQRFIRHSARKLWFVVDSVPGAMEYLDGYSAVEKSI